MDASRLTNRLLSRIVPAMVISAVLAAAAQPAAAASPARFTPVADSQTGLTPAQIQKLRQFAMGPEGVDGTITPLIASALGLGNHTQNIYFRSYAVEDTDTKNSYQMYFLPNNSGYILLHWNGTTNAVFRLDAQLNFVASVGAPPGGASVYAIPRGQAMQLCEAEIATWRAIADTVHD